MVIGKLAINKRIDVNKLLQQGSINLYISKRPRNWQTQVGGQFSKCGKLKQIFLLTPHIDIFAFVTAMPKKMIFIVNSYIEISPACISCSD